MVPLPACPRHSYTWIVPITWKTSETVGADRYWLTEVSGMACPGSGGPAATSPALRRSGSPRGALEGGAGGGGCDRRSSSPPSNQRAVHSKQPQLAPAEPQRQRVLPRQLQPGELGPAPCAALQRPPGTRGWPGHPPGHTPPAPTLPAWGCPEMPTLPSQAIPVINRAQIIDDAFNLAR